MFLYGLAKMSKFDAIKELAKGKGLTENKVQPNFISYRLSVWDCNCKLRMRIQY